MHSYYISFIMYSFLADSSHSDYLDYDPITGLRVNVFSFFQILIFMVFFSLFFYSTFYYHLWCLYLQTYFTTHYCFSCSSHFDFSSFRYFNFNQLCINLDSTSISSFRFLILFNHHLLYVCANPYSHTTISLIARPAWPWKGDARLYQCCPHNYISLGMSLLRWVV